MKLDLVDDAGSPQGVLYIRSGVSRLVAEPAANPSVTRLQVFFGPNRRIMQGGFGIDSTLGELDDHNPGGPPRFVHCAPATGVPTGTVTYVLDYCMIFTRQSLPALDVPRKWIFVDQNGNDVAYFGAFVAEGAEIASEAPLAPDTDLDQ